MQSEHKLDRKYRFDALGTVWWLEAEVNQSVFERAEQIARQFHADYSRFEPDSVLSRLNTDKICKDPSDEFRSLIQYGLDAFKKTNGVFNMSAGGVLTKNGYGKIGASDRMASNLPEVVELHGDEIRIIGDYTLDFGGFGKGYLIDKLFAYLAEHTDGDIVVNGGGDMRVRFGEPQEIPLMHPYNPKKFYKKIQIKEGSLASSSPLHRAWGDNNHLVTMNSDSYSGDIAQLTIQANTAVEADMLATSLLIDPSLRGILDRSESVSVFYAKS